MSSTVEPTRPRASTQEEGSTYGIPSDIAQRAQATVQHGKQIVDDAIVERPGSTVLLGFVVGAGIGTLLGAVLFEQSPKRRQSMSEGLIQRIAETVSRTVRETLPASLGR